MLAIILQSLEIHMVPTPINRLDWNAFYFLLTYSKHLIFHLPFEFLVSETQNCSVWASFFFLMCMCVLLFFNINLFNWRLITILYWFCHISTWIRHGYTRVPHPEPPSHFPPHTIPLVIPVHQPQASCFMHRTWTGDSFEWQQGYSPLSKHF